MKQKNGFSGQKGEATHTSEWADRMLEKGESRGVGPSEGPGHTIADHRGGH